MQVQSCHRQLHKLIRIPIRLCNISYRGFAQLKKTRKSMSPEDVRKAQMSNDPSGLLKLAMKAEEDFYATEGGLDLEQIQKETNNIGKEDADLEEDFYATEGGLDL